MAIGNPIKFLSEVRAEAEKVTWPTRRETIITSIMVVFMAFAASIFFLVSDQIISRTIAFLLSIGR